VLSLKGTIDLLIYLSVCLGILLLLQIWSIVPSWLFYAVLLGWIVYLSTAIAVAMHHQRAYVGAFILAVLTLLASLPRPEHYEFVRAGVSLATLTFTIGSALQACIIITIITHFLRQRSTVK